MNNTNKILPTILYTVSCFIEQSIINSSSSGILDEKGKFEWYKRMFVILTSRTDLVYGRQNIPGAEGDRGLILDSTVYCSIVKVYHKVAKNSLRV